MTPPTKEPHLRFINQLTLPAIRSVDQAMTHIQGAIQRLHDYAVLSEIPNLQTALLRLEEASNFVRAECELIDPKIQRRLGWSEK